MQDSRLPECPVQFLLRTPARGDVYGQQEFLKVDETVFVGVERAENVITKFVGISRGEAFAVDLHERHGRQPAIWAVAFKA